jgi:hypothetical protein
MKQIEIARTLLGHRENAGNKFEDTSPLGRMLHLAGQKDGEAWCCYFAEGIFCEAFPLKDKELRKLFSAGAVATFKNFSEANYDCHANPKVGDLMIMQNYKAGVKQWTGHAGIVTKVNADGSFETIEGNTNGAGSREGDQVAVKVRKNVYRADGLNVLGFVTIE